MMKGLTSIAVLLAALAAILGFSVAGALREERRVLDEFAFTIRQQVHTAAQALSTRLNSLDQDTRMLADLVERSRNHRDFDEATDKRVWESAFRALAVVVDPYRLIAFVTPDGHAHVTAPDPTEAAATIAAIQSSAEHFGKDISVENKAVLGAAFAYQSRWFFLYGTPVPGGGTIVVASDEAIFLRTVAGTPLPSAHLYVRDPSGVIWTDCEDQGHCHPAQERDLALDLRPANGAKHGTWQEEAASMGLGKAPKVQVSEEIVRPTGKWTVTWMASSEAIIRHEGGLLLRIVITAIAAALVVASVGGMILRQQRRALALEGQLRYAEAVASARNLETQLVRAEKLVTVGVLSAELAHEIGNPLAVIRGRAEQVLADIGSAARAEDLRVIIKHIDNISSTIRQLLDFSRRPPAERHAVALALVVDRTRGLMQWKLDATGVHLDVDLAHDLPMVMADPDQLQQVLVNLLLNACDASASGGIVLVRAREDDGMVRIAVVDYGSGISKEHVQAVFEPFFTTKNRGEGTGLGLPIAASIVRAHGGRIDLSSVSGKGTTVTIHWPAHAAVEGEHG